MEEEGEKEKNCIAVVLRFLEAENRRDWKAWAKELHEEVVYVEQTGGEHVARAERYVAAMREVYKSLPDWVFRVVEVSCSNGRVFVRFDGEGHFCGVYKGTAYKDVPIRLQSACAFGFKEGLIVSVEETYDRSSFERQLATVGIAAGLPEC